MDLQTSFLIRLRFRLSLSLISGVTFAKAGQPEFCKRQGTRRRQGSPWSGLSDCAELRPSNHKAEDIKTHERRRRGSITNKMADMIKAGAQPEPAFCEIIKNGSFLLAKICVDSYFWFWIENTAFLEWKRSE